MGSGNGLSGTTNFSLRLEAILADLTEEERARIRLDITEILEELGAGNITFEEFREGSVIVPFTTENPVSPERLDEEINKSNDIKTVGSSRIIITSINEELINYPYKLILIPQSDDREIIYINAQGENANTITTADIEAVPEIRFTSIKIGNSVTTIGDTAFSSGFRFHNLVSVTIPEGVTTIGESAFEGCSALASLTIPEGVTTIGATAFFQCSSLTSVKIPEGVTTIGVNTFNRCTSLDSVTIPEGVTTIRENAFERCSSLVSITLPESLITLGERAFSSCQSLEEIIIPDSVTQIGDNCFNASRNIASITLGKSVSGDISRQAFNGMSGLQNFIVDPLNESFSSQDGVLFRGTTLFEYPIGNTRTNYTVQNTTTSIEQGAFSGANLQSVSLEEGLETIGEQSFQNVSGISEIIIPSTVTSISGSAFFNCTGLTNVTIGNPDFNIIDHFTFSGCPAVDGGDGIFLVPNGMENITFRSFNGNFSNSTTDGEDAELEFGAFDNPDLGFKRVLLKAE